jgi:hypothetical protein
MIKKKIILLITIILINGCFNNTIENKQFNIENLSSPHLINESINNGINFLYKSQLEYGEFKTYACKDKKMTNCYFDSSPFITTFVLYSIKNIQNNKVKIMTNNSIKFLLSEVETGGIWKYWTSRNLKQINPDLDNITTISHTLMSNQIEFENNINIIQNNKNREGLFLTWLNMSLEDNDIDCIVNTNTLLYLNENNPKICNYINNAIKNNEKCSIYYPDELSLYYTVSRAFINNISCLNKNKNRIINRILSKKKDNGSFGNSLQTAFAINTLINYDYTGTEINQGIEYLIKTQKKNGSWPKETFFIDSENFYGSEELTTSISIEALNKYLFLI